VVPSGDQHQDEYVGVLAFAADIESGTAEG
jgi:hypothetical protein